MSENLEKIDKLTYKAIKHMNREQMNEVFEKLTEKAVQRGYEKAVRETAMSIFYTLHRLFGFGNQRIGRVFEASMNMLGLIHTGKESVSHLQEILVAENIVCLRDDSKDQAKPEAKP